MWLKAVKKKLVQLHVRYTCVCVFLLSQLHIPRLGIESLHQGRSTEADQFYWFIFIPLAGTILATNIEKPSNPRWRRTNQRGQLMFTTLQAQNNAHRERIPCVLLPVLLIGASAWFHMFNHWLYHSRGVIWDDFRENSYFYLRHEWNIKPVSYFLAIVIAFFGCL